MSTDWQTMDAGRELDRVIAERLGYMAVELAPEHAMQSGYSEETGLWYVVSPEQPNVAMNPWGKASAEEAWQDALRPDCEGGYAASGFQVWSASVDAALSLPFPDRCYLFMAMGATGRAWFSPNVDGRMIADLGYEGTTIGLSPQERMALAICRAWLAWQESKQAEGDD